MTSRAPHINDTDLTQECSTDYSMNPASTVESHSHLHHHHQVSYPHHTTQHRRRHSRETLDQRLTGGGSNGDDLFDDICGVNECGHESNYAEQQRLVANQSPNFGYIAGRQSHEQGGPAKDDAEV